MASLALSIPDDIAHRGRPGAGRLYEMRTASGYRGFPDKLKAGGGINVEDRFPYCAICGVDAGGRSPPTLPSPCRPSPPARCLRRIVDLCLREPLPPGLAGPPTAEANDGFEMEGLGKEIHGLHGVRTITVLSHSCKIAHERLRVAGDIDDRFRPKLSDEIHDPSPGSRPGGIEHHQPDPSGSRD